MIDGTFFIHYLTISKTFGYLLVFLGMIIEGDAVLFTAAFLTRTNNFDLGDMFLVVLSGSFVGDILWYHLGLKLNNYQKLAFLRAWMDKISKPLDPQLHKRPFKIIFISKFLYGLHHAILMRAGNLKFPVKKFMQIDATAIVAWIMIVGGLGYLSGVSFSFFKHYLRFAEIMLVVGLLAFLSLIHFIRPWMIKSFADNSNKNTTNKSFLKVI